MIQLSCIKEYHDKDFIKGEEYMLLLRRGGGFVEMIDKYGCTRDFVNNSNHESKQYYKILTDFFDLVPQNKRMTFFEKINNKCEIKL